MISADIREGMLLKAKQDSRVHHLKTFIGEGYHLKEAPKFDVAKSSSSGKSEDKAVFM